MTKVIDFKTPAQLRDELAASEAQCQALQAKLSGVNGVNEMLKLQILDLQDQLKAMITQMEIIQNNLSNLAGKLPRLD